MSKSIPDVVTWAESFWRLKDIPGKPFIKLTEWQKVVLLDIFPADGSVPPWETYLISTVKKSGKTEIDAIATAYGALTAPPPETAFCMANDAQQAEGRVFDRIASAFRLAGMEKSGEAKITKAEIVLATGTKIKALAADYAGGAGEVFGITSWTELWAFRYESHTRLWEEFTPTPPKPGRRNIRIVDSYAGFQGDAPILEPMWNRALQGDPDAPDGGRPHGTDFPVYTAGKLYAFIDQGEEAQRRAYIGTPGEREAYYTEQRASLKPSAYNRLHQNMWAAGEEAFITAHDYDSCVSESTAPIPPNPTVSIWVGVDVGTKRDSSAVIAVTRDKHGRLVLARHRIWTPKRGQELDLESTVEAFLLELKAGYRLVEVRYDPSQMVSSAQRLRKTHTLPMVEFSQTTEHLGQSSTNLYDAFRDRFLTLYPTATDLRAHCLNAVAVTMGSDRGWKIAKEKSSKKVDGAVALSFATYGATAGRQAAICGVTKYRIDPGPPTIRIGDLTLTGARYVDADEQRGHVLDQIGGQAGVVRANAARRHERSLLERAGRNGPRNDWGLRR